MACEAVTAPNNALNSDARKISARRLARTVKDKFKLVPHSKAFVKKALARREGSVSGTRAGVSTHHGMAPRAESKSVDTKIYNKNNWL